MKKQITLLILSITMFSCKSTTNSNLNLPEDQINSKKEIDSLEGLADSNKILFNEYLKTVNNNQYKRICLNWYGVLKNINSKEIENTIVVTGDFEFDEYFYYSFKYYLNKNEKTTDVFYNKIKKLTNGDFIYISGAIDYPNEIQLIGNENTLSFGQFTIYPFDVSTKKIIYSENLLKTFEFQNQIWFNMKNNPTSFKNADKKEAEILVEKLNESEKEKMRKYTNALGTRFQLGNQ
jgi:hypothetical protein